ncbi:copper resistance protein CopC [Radiobacillus sp. PE A8.2]|uniref:copper resistance CopC family protein n=1 Tax=Radiobacillus sp. PE A8.2 TaxID=3380349 RepID=UPI00389090BA
MTKGKKRVIMLIGLLVFSLLQIKTVNAHSVLEIATPKDGAQLESPITNIELSFNTKVENGSTLYVVKNNETKIQPNSVKINDNTMVGVFNELDAGIYQVKWKILGADGHIIDGEYSFTIAAQDDDEQTENAGDKNKEEQTENTTPTDPTETQETVDEGKQTNEESLDQSTQEDVDTASDNAVTKDTKDEGESSFLVYGIIIIFSILVVALFLWLLFAKSKK